MALDDWFTVATDRHSSPEFFRRSPFKSPFFLMDTCAGLLSIIGTSLVLIRRWGHLPEFGAGWLLVVMAGMVVLWLRALRDHQRIHQLFKTGSISEVRPGSPLDAALRTAASMTIFGLFFTFFLAGSLVINVVGFMH